MCGIYLHLLFGNPSISKNYNFQCDCHISKFLSNRGPDSFHHRTKTLHSDIIGYFAGHVLHQQGSRLTVQPLEDEKSNILLWNGEIYGRSENEQSDTEALGRKLAECKNGEDLPRLLSLLDGPWAIIYWHHATKTLWFGRDPMGRRSLLFGLLEIESSKSLFFTSVASSSLSCNQHSNVNFKEFPANGMHSLSCKDSSNGLEFDFYPWVPQDFSIPVAIHDNIYIRQQNPLLLPTFLNRNEISLDIPNCEDQENIFPSYLQIAELKQAVDKLTSVLSEAVRLRVNHSQMRCKDCYVLKNDSECLHANIAILFSGGLDSAVIAALAHKHVDSRRPIDLINVAFEQTSNAQKEKKNFPHKNSHSQKSEPGVCNYNVPDRISGLNALRELKENYPDRKWNFIEVNVTKEQLVKTRLNCITHLIYPRCTVLDDSIGCAIWFAASGKGLLNDSENKTPYLSPSKVVLVGMGADEQLAGYSRHREVFRKNGMSGLLNEIQLEVDRIWHRNLGRDDRVISDHGREARFPFLDEKVMKYLQSLPMSYKVDFSLPRGIGEKLILRLVAYKLGLWSTAGLPKRAIQFGSRIAKLENRKEKASDVCQRLNDVTLESKKC